MPGTPGASQGEGRGFELPSNLSKAEKKQKQHTGVIGNLNSVCEFSVGLMVFVIIAFFSWCLLLCEGNNLKEEERKKKKPNPKEPVNKAKLLTHESALNEKGRGRCFSFCDELLAGSQFAICLWESPRRSL